MSQDHAHAEDQALLHRLRAGEDAAFGELFSRHCDAVRRLALGLAADRAEAEDLTAEAFFRVLQAIRRGSGPTDNVRGYLLIVARRVAWEWNGRRRDVPISDEELNHRVGADPDRTNQSTERNLITRAFTSLPERWRSVLWEVEVEGARPAVVAVNFGLSPNATAALARRARQGLRAAYLQAHLAIDRGSTGCRSVLEKLGAYTAGTIKGVERRKVRAHLATCPSCMAMFAELQDVCSGLRAHAAVLAAPVAGVALWQQMGTAASAASSAAGWTVKGMLANAKVQVALAASSAAAVGAFGFVMVAMGGSTTTNSAFDDFDGRPLPDVVITQTSDATPGPNPAQPTKSSGKAATHEPGTPATPAAQDAKTPSADAPALLRTDEARPPAEADAEAQQVVAPKMAPGEVYDESQPVVYERSTFERKWAVYDQYDVVNESTTTTRVNALEQTTVVTKTTEYTVYKTPTTTGDSRAALMSSPPAEPTAEETPVEETKPTSEPEPVTTEPSTTTADPKPSMTTAS